MDKEDLIRVAKTGAVDNYDFEKHSLPPVILIVRSHNDVISHVFGDKDLYIIQDKIYKLLTALDAKSYVLISSGQATEFTETAKEIKDITLMAQEDRVNILILFYVENGKEVTTEFTIINRDSVDADETELEWKKDSIEIIHNIIIKRW